MRALVVLACLLAVCVAQRPRPCRSPPLLSGALSVSTQNEKLWTYAKYIYDALGQRVRIREIGSYQNQTFKQDALLLFRQGILYEIHDHNRTCKRVPLKSDFHPLEVPRNASLLGQAVVGSSSGPGQGLLINSWYGDIPQTGGKYLFTVSAFGCIPVTAAVQTKEFGWVATNYFNNVIGIPDPSMLNPPDYCLRADMEDVEPVDFFSVFHKNNE
ncbi:ependymin-like [Salarias fasciatus]|uniref:Ependymin-like n=1 Tax=Salarias fasciatus TaxID=181472 RepID=A0A672GUB8_SALFA|nr:ependymin-like [Salarias fasciatus]